MLTSLRLVNFKNFADETLKLGPFTVIVGANASGKSNIRDAFRFLHGIGRGYTLAEIMGGKLGPGGYVEWDGIRGAPNEIVRFGQSDSPGSGEFTLSVGMRRSEESTVFSATVGFNPDDPDGFRWLSDDTLVNGQPAMGSVSFASQWHRISESPRPYLTRNLGDESPYDDVRLHIRSVLENMRFLDPSPAQMREPSIPGATTLGDHGQNLPTVLESICADADRKQTLLSWFEELTPMDVAGFEFPRDPSGRVHLQILERNGRKVSAYSASDGTLRFLGILAALMNENAGGIYFFEEIDTGIHPNRLWLLLDLIERQTAKGKMQVITTTHNPALLDWIRDETFEHTSVIYRDEYWSDSVIRPIADLYHLRELRKSRGLGRLFTSGWLESAMKASEGDFDTDHLDDDDEDDWGIAEE
ncbi:MAG: AAA family ATPase [Chloroflexi bacterium]|nr:AAA family ATPase [Chloroflexota bacterium]